jgi:hypothetical protein
MSEATAAVAVDPQPTTKQKIALGTTNVLIGIAVTVAASYVTTQLQGQAEKLIIQKKRES